MSRYILVVSSIFCRKLGFFFCGFDATRILSKKMASNFVSEDFETSDGLPKDNGFILEVYETNYHFEKRFAVHGYNTVGQLILFIVQEIGKSLFSFNPLFVKGSR